MSKKLPPSIVAPKVDSGNVCPVGRESANATSNSGPEAVPSPAESASKSKEDEKTEDPQWRRRLLASIVAVPALTDMQAAAQQCQTVRREVNGNAAEAVNSWCNPVGGAPAKLSCKMYDTDAMAADWLTRAATSLPVVGEHFLGFRLVALLGRGGYGQVYLAEQGDLANRRVVLKVATDIFGESQTLAQLQHTNIVPIHSIHRASPFQAVCMPYFGATTLADVLEQLHGGTSLPHSGKMLVSTVNDRMLSTRRSVSSHSFREWALLPALDAADAKDGPSVLPRGVDASATLQKLEGMTYVEAVLWMVARLADGLAQRARARHPASRLEAGQYPAYR